MQRVKYIPSYLFSGLFHLLALLPMSFLHVLSSFTAFLMSDIVRYRRRIVMENLRNSFPGKDEAEIRKIARKFYLNLTDVEFETIKLLRISDREIIRRCRIREEDKSMILDMYANRISFIGMLGHLGNWEWVPPATTLNLPFKIVPVYRPLKDKVIDRLMLKLRGRYAAELVSKKLTGRALVKYIKGGDPFVLGLISDQTPTPKTAYWIDFLNQETPVYYGPEKLARSTGMPVIFVAMRRQGRGKYLLHIELITDNPSGMKEGEITLKFMKLLEKEIERSPSDWLWSHRRWKHKRAETPAG